jgi:8-oxo-dGTP diphosphatase / 2-hydroxy-dATP diphosphatase
MKKLLTLCVVHKENQVLLGMKKRGFGQGRWNGFGGKLMEGERIEIAARRETEEEAGLKALDIKERGVLTFEFKDDPEILEVHVFSASVFEGKLAETEEMKPKWFNVKDIPYGKMWPDDKYWLPLLLNGKNFQGNFYFRDNDTLLNYQLKEV